VIQPLQNAYLGVADRVPVEQWQEDLLADRLGRIRSILAANGLGTLDVVRSPAPSVPNAATNRFLLEYWLSERGDALPPVSAVDPVRLGPALGRIVVVEPVARGEDFRYRLFGTDVAAVAGYDMTGKMLSAHPLAPELAGLVMALYRVMMQRPEAVLTVNHPRFTGQVSWERIVLPFAGPDGAVKRFVVGHAAFGADGRELRR
jgi:hypothetical protein